MKNDSHIKLGWRMLVAIRRGKVAFSETMSLLLSNAITKMATVINMMTKLCLHFRTQESYVLRKASFKIWRDQNLFYFVEKCRWKLLCYYSGLKLGFDKISESKPAWIAWETKKKANAASSRAEKPPETEDRNLLIIRDICINVISINDLLPFEVMLFHFRFWNIG